MRGTRIRGYLQEGSFNMDRLETLEKRLLALQARADVVDIYLLEAEYARAWDFGTGEEWANVFSEGGVFELTAVPGVAPLPGQPGQRFAGHAALAEFCNAFRADWTMQHQMHLPSVKIDGDRASSIVYFDCPIAAHSAGLQSMVQRETGVYHVEYVRGSQGWRMSRRIEYPTFRFSSRFLGVPGLPD